MADSSKDIQLRELKYVITDLKNSTAYALWDGFGRNSCMGDVPEVLQQPALLPSGKRLEAVWCVHHKGDHGKLGHPQFRCIFPSDV